MNNPFGNGFNPYGAPRGFGQLQPTQQPRQRPNEAQQLQNPAQERTLPQPAQTPLQTAIRPPQSPQQLIAARPQPNATATGQLAQPAVTSAGGINGSMGDPNIMRPQSPAGTIIPPQLNLPRRDPNGYDGSGIGAGTIRPGQSANDVIAPTPATPATPPPAPAFTPDPNWDTDGYAAPQHIAANVGNVMPGWDATKFGNANHQTPKYVVGRILSNYPPTVDGLKAAMAEIEKAYPGATFNGKDKVTLPGIGTTDVLRGASVGGKGWQWLGENRAKQMAQGNPTVNPLMMSASLANAIGGAAAQNNALATIPDAARERLNALLAQLTLGVK